MKLKYELKKEVIDGIKSPLLEETYLLNVTTTMRDAFIVGQRGSGKSIFAIKWAIAQSEVDPEFYEPFDLYKHLFFTREDLLEYLKYLFYHPPERYVNLVFDDAGVDANNKKWWEEFSIQLGQVLQSYRFLKANLFVTVPFASLMLKETRKLFTTLIICEKRLERKGYTLEEVKTAYVYNVTSSRGRFLRDYLYGDNKQFPKRANYEIDIGHLDEELYAEYEELKRAALAGAIFKPEGDEQPTAR